MATYFPDARVTSYEKLIGSMANHPKDRHVLAAAVAGRADALVTENLTSPASAVPCCRPGSLRDSRPRSKPSPGLPTHLIAHASRTGFQPKTHC